jgi:hypothetical protein
MMRDLGFTVLGHESEALEEASEPWLTGGLGRGGSLARRPNA